MLDLEGERVRATEMLKANGGGRRRHRDDEIVIEFDGGTRLFVDSETSTRATRRHDAAPSVGVRFESGPSDVQLNHVSGAGAGLGHQRR